MKKFKMRESVVMKKLRAGKVANCFKCNLGNARVFEIAAMFGFDCLWSCNEHIPTDWSQMEKQILAAKAYDTDIIVRVSKGGYSDLIKPLEIDATGIMVPHVMDGKEAGDIAKTTKFYPVGRRPADGGNADGKFCNIPFTEYIKQANEQRFVIVQIEDPEAVEHLDEICSTDGIDIIFYGAGDFSHTIGKPGQFDDKEVVRVRKFIAKTAEKYGKYAGAVASKDNYQDLVDMGYRFLSIGADVVGLSQYCEDLATFLKNN